MSATKRRAAECKGQRSLFDNSYDDEARLADMETLARGSDPAACKAAGKRIERDCDATMERIIASQRRAQYSAPVPVGITAAHAYYVERVADGLGVDLDQHDKPIAHGSMADAWKAVSRRGLNPDEHGVTNVEPFPIDEERHERYPVRSLRVVIETPDGEGCALMGYDRFGCECIMAGVDAPTDLDAWLAGDCAEDLHSLRALWVEPDEAKSPPISSKPRY